MGNLFRDIGNDIGFEGKLHDILQSIVGKIRGRTINSVYYKGNTDLTPEIVDKIFLCLSSIFRYVITLYPYNI